ncbi:MAG: hypothetical protein C0594_09185 [Marinilabiliales bacterium]|nr:MAG: hypothetical protein C0594_09185 [Marinilabiliales bacterium]
MIGAFEDFSTKYWSMPSAASPDIFSTQVDEKCWTYACSPGSIKTSAGHQIPRTGSNMVGIYTYGMYRGSEYHEYLQTKLKEPLIPGNRYYVEFWVCRSCLVETASNNIGVFFTGKLINRKSTRSFYNNPQINAEEVVTESKEWTKISGFFTAKYPHEVMIIGNFHKDADTKIRTVEACNNKKLLSQDEAYYYIDDILVRVAEKTEVDEKNKVNDFSKLQKGESIILENIFFDFDEAIILKKSFPELEKLYRFLKQNQHIIEISGHTDNVGSKEYNKLLSEERAQAVVDYLIDKGINQERLKSRGFGSSEPIATNKDEVGRAQNRRVEIKIIE